MSQKRGCKGENAKDRGPSLDESVSREMRGFQPPEIPRALVSLFKSTMEEITAQGGAQNAFGKLYSAVHQGMLVYPVQHAVVDVLNDRGDEEITYHFELSNFGLSPVSSSIYPFWFRQEQGDVPFTCHDETGEQLAVEIVRSSPSFRDVRVNFRRPLEALETLRLTISYRLRGVFLTDCFYCLRPRALTHRIGLTVITPENLCFTNVRISRESAEGFMKDDLPVPQYSREFGRVKLYWDFRSPTSGDLFRTAWSYAEQPEGDDYRPGRVIPFRRSAQMPSLLKTTLDGDGEG